MLAARAVGAAADLIVGDGPAMAQAQAVLAENAAVGNDFAALFAAATLGIAAGFTGDHDSGLRWTEELLHRAAALGNHDVGDMLEQRGGHLAAAGRPDDAVRTFSASAARQRRVGRRWPRTDGTAELLDRLRDRLGTSRFALAWRAGAHLDLAELVPELTGPGVSSRAAARPGSSRPGPAPPAPAPSCRARGSSRPGRSSVSKSTVTQNGVPISSWRR